MVWINKYVFKDQKKSVCVCVCVCVCDVHVNEVNFCVWYRISKLIYERYTHQSIADAVPVHETVEIVNHKHLRWQKIS